MSDGNADAVRGGAGQDGGVHGVDAGGEWCSCASRAPQPTPPAPEGGCGVWIEGVPWWNCCGTESSAREMLIAVFPCQIGDVDRRDSHSAGQ